MADKWQAESPDRFYGQLAIADRGALAQNNNSWRGGREDARLPRELSALSRISQGAILQRGRDASMDRLRQVMMRNFLPNTPPSLPLTMSSHQNNNKSYLEFYKIGSSFFNLAFASGKKISSILCKNQALQETRLSYGNLYIPLVVRWVVACTK